MRHNEVEPTSASNDQPLATARGSWRSFAADYWPAPILAGVMALAAVHLHHVGRPWWCVCGNPSLWSGNIHSSHNSQHLVDPYSFTHMLHGVLFCGLLTWFFPQTRLSTRFWMALAIEVGWELLENSELVIHRYRTATISLGYEGDSILNSFGDILSCSGGFALAAWLGLRGSIALFVVAEACLMLWIRDSFLLSTIMLIHPWEALKAWQQAS